MLYFSYKNDKMNCKDTKTERNEKKKKQFFCVVALFVRLWSQ